MQVKAIIFNKQKKRFAARPADSQQRSFDAGKSKRFVVESKRFAAHPAKP